MHRAVLLTLCFLIPGLLVACNSGAGPSRPPTPEVIVDDDVQVLEPATAEALDAFELDLSTGLGELRFTAGDPALDALAPGMILVSRPVAGVAPHGFLQRIVTKRQEGSQVVFGTEQALLIETFEQAEIDFRQTLEPSQVVAANSRYAGISLRSAAAEEPLSPQAGTSFDFRLNFDKVLIDADGDASTTDDRLHIDGDFYFNAAASADVDIDCCQEVEWLPDILPYLDLFEFKVSLDESVDLSLTGDLGLSFDETVEVARYVFGAFTVMVGPVPVVFVVDLVVDIGAQGQIAAHLSVGATQSSSLQLGARYTDAHGWEDLTSFDSDFDFPMPDIEASASARAFAKPMLSVKIYGLAGPYVYAEPFVTADAEQYRDPFWRFTAGMDFGLGFVIDLPIVGRVAAWDTRLAGFEEPLGESDNQAPVLDHVSPADGAWVTEGEPLGFSVKASDREQEEVDLRLEDAGGVLLDEATFVHGGHASRLEVAALPCVGSHLFHIRAIDDSRASDERTVAVNVRNHVPEVTLATDQLADLMFYPGGYLLAYASLLDRVCPTGEPADQDLIHWFLDDVSVGYGRELFYRLPASLTAGDEIALQARYDDGTDEGRSEAFMIPLQAKPPGTDLAPQALLMWPEDHIYLELIPIVCEGGSFMMRLEGAGFDTEDGKLTDGALVWDFTPLGGSSLPAGTGSRTDFDLCSLGSGQGLWGIYDVRLTVTDSAGGTDSVVSRITIGPAG